MPHRPYHPAYTNAVFRGWYDFGAGSLGDMGHYSFFQIFKILRLGSPLTVEASRSQYWRIDDLLWKKQINTVSYPQASLIRWEFPERPGTAAGRTPLVRRRPAPPQASRAGGGPASRCPTRGCSSWATAARSWPTSRATARGSSRRRRCRPSGPRRRPCRGRPRSCEQWVRACRGTAPSDASFESVAGISETILLGNIALRVDKKLRWDAANARFADAPEADALMTRPEYREGWKL